MELLETAVLIYPGKFQLVTRYWGESEPDSRRIIVECPVFLGYGAEWGDNKNRGTATMPSYITS